MKIIIISGYSDFEYAKLAVKLGVSDYLLKPVDPKEFEPAMRKIMDDIDNEKIEKVFMEQSMSFMKQHYLYSLVEQNIFHYSNNPFHIRFYYQKFLLLL